MREPEAWRSVAEARPLVVDGLLALVVFGSMVVMPLVDPDHSAGPLGVRLVVLASAASGALVFRRRRPLPVLGVVVVAAAVDLASGVAMSPLKVAVMLALYSVARRRTLSLAVGTAVGVAALLVAAGVSLGGEPLLTSDVIAIVTQCGLATALGAGLRVKRAYAISAGQRARLVEERTRLLEERARVAEESREEELRRRVIDERLRIARELHDVLAHHIALINVQAGVAAHVLDSEPDQARESLAHIRKAAGSALEEVKTTIGLLRQPGQSVDASVEPSPGLDHLVDLVAGLTAAGLVVDRRTSGPPVELPATVDLTAYRVIQESLTNASKHAARPYATLTLEYLAAELRIVVANPAAPAPVGSGGHGLLGMGERARAVGGSFASGFAGDCFEVRVVLPYEGSVE